MAGGVGLVGDGGLVACLGCVVSGLIVQLDLRKRSKIDRKRFGSPQWLCKHTRLEM